MKTTTRYAHTRPKNLLTYNNGKSSIQKECNPTCSQYDIIKKRCGDTNPKYAEKCRFSEWPD